MDILDWFDIHNIEHLKAWDILDKKGCWPDGFIPGNITFDKNVGWHSVLAHRMAVAYVAGYILPSPSPMKLIGDEENIWHNFPIAEIEAWQDGRNKQLSADRLTRDKKREELEATIAGLKGRIEGLEKYLQEKGQE